MIVFAPAAAGIRKAINVQEADRLASTLEQELVTYRGETLQGEDTKIGFAKAFQFVKDSDDEKTALLVYQYRADLKATSRSDGTAPPVAKIDDKMPGDGYVVQTMVRRRNDPEFEKDLDAGEGGVYLVKCTQLVFDGGELKLGTIGSIKDPKSGGNEFDKSSDYPEAVIAFAADFYTLPAKSSGFFSSRFSTSFKNAKKPVFTRNLAVRR